MASHHKNIQVIDGAINCVYDIFASTSAEFNLIFPKGTDIAFIEEVYRRNSSCSEKLHRALNRIWKRRIAKREAQGIHGILFYQLKEKTKFYPTRRDEEAVNPGGYPLRQISG